MIDITDMIGKKIHFIGVGGVSMSGLAAYFAKCDKYKVSGSDVKGPEENQYLKFLEQLGNVRLFKGHKKENVDDADCVVVTSTIGDDNPEIMRARELGLPIFERFQVINSLISGFKNKTAIFGGAGKTTTTALTWALFKGAGLEPSLFLGSILNGLESSVYLEPENKAYVVFEADESDASFAKMPVSAGIFVAMEADHLDHPSYGGSYPKMLEKFENFLRQMKAENMPICYNADSPDTKALVLKVYGASSELAKSYSMLDNSADFYANNIRYDKTGKMFFDVFYLGSLLQPGVELPMIGEYNVSNVLGGLGMLSFFADKEKLGEALKSLKSFKGVDKRLSSVGRFKNFEIIDDYAHSPLKISSLLKGFSGFANQVGAGVVAVCECHKHSRLNMMYEDYLTCFDGLNENDCLVMMDIYAVPGYAGERLEIGNLINDIKSQNKKIEILYSRNNELPNRLYELIKSPKYAGNSKNFLLFFGAGLSSFYAKNMQKMLEDLENARSR